MPDIAPSGAENFSENRFLVHSEKLPERAAGELLSLPRQQAGWDWMSFFVRRLQPGDVFRARTDREEAAFVLLGGNCQVDWGQGAVRIGKRKNVFDGLPYALYLPAGNEAVFTAETTCEIAECRAPSEARLQPKLITPSDVASGLRGGGNASRQIVDIITPAFPADKLMVIEVYTPAATGRVILRISTTCTILPAKWIWTRSITIESVSPKDLPCSISIPANMARIKP